MGRLRYDGTSEPILIDDETLAHLKVVVGTKLRRQESFMMTWLPKPEASSGRLTIWVHPAIPLVFEFDLPTVHAIDPARVAHMMDQLNSRGELVLDQL